jgi:tetratricopeptide (TPR) repeat protein
MGVVLAAKGNHRDGEADDRVALTLEQKLIDKFPTNPSYRDVKAKTHNNLASVLMETGRPLEAEYELRKALSIWQALVDDYPAVLVFRNNLGFLRVNLGSLMEDKGSPREAEGEFRLALAVLRKLAEDYPDVPFYRGNVAGTYLYLGRLMMTQGHVGEAINCFERGRELYFSLAETLPGVPSYRRGLARTSVKLAAGLIAIGRWAEARAEADRAVVLWRALPGAKSRSGENQAGLSEALLRAGQTLRAESDLAGAVAHLRDAVGTIEAAPLIEAEAMFLLGCCHAQLSRLASSPGSGLPVTDGVRKADAAMGELHKAVGMGYRRADALRTESALGPLRDRPDFQLLIMDMAFPSEPFANGR